jgi:hypothetical protein
MQECVDYLNGSSNHFPISESTIKKWIGNPRLFNTGMIEGHANVNLNYHIKGDSTLRTFTVSRGWEWWAFKTTMNENNERSRSGV